MAGDPPSRDPSPDASEQFEDYEEEDWIDFEYQSSEEGLEEELELQWYYESFRGDKLSSAFREESWGSSRTTSWESLPSLADSEPDPSDNSSVTSSSSPSPTPFGQDQLVSQSEQLGSPEGPPERKPYHLSSPAVFPHSDCAIQPACLDRQQPQPQHRCSLTQPVAGELALQVRAISDLSLYQTDLTEWYQLMEEVGPRYFKKEIPKKRLSASYSDVHVESIKTLGNNQPYQQVQGYVNCAVSYRGKTLQVKALLDSGNSLQAASCMSSAVFNQLEGKYCKYYSPSPVGTANAGSRLKIEGQAQPLTLSIPFEGDRVVQYKIKPLISPQLSDQLNLGNLFLKRIGATLQFNSEGVKLSIQTQGPSADPVKMNKSSSVGEGRLVPLGPNENFGNIQKRFGEHLTVQLINTIRKPPKPPDQHDIVCQTNTLVEPESVSWVKISVPTSFVSQLQSAPNTVWWVPGITGIRPGESGLVQAMYRGHQPELAIGNTTDEKIRVQAGQVIGKLHIVAKKTPTPQAVQSARKDHFQGPETLNHRLSGEAPYLLQDPEKKENPQTPAEQEAQLLKDLDLDSSPILAKDPALKKRVEQLVKSKKAAFAGLSTGAVGRCSLVEFTLDVDPDAKPVKHRARPLNPRQQESLDRQIDEWIRHGIAVDAVPDDDCWVSPLVPVSKPDGTIRWAVDFRSLNEKTKMLHASLPRVDSNLEKLGGSSIFSCLDQSWAYHNIECSPKTRKFLYVASPSRTLQFRRLTFGLSNAGVFYNRMVTKMLEGYPESSVLTYFDDIMIHGACPKDHLRVLRDVLSLHVKHGVLLNPRKTKLFRTSVAYLGFQISAKGFTVKSSYLDKLAKWPTPKSLKAVEGFLGFVGYYRVLIRNLAARTRHLSELRKHLRAKKPFYWGENEQKEFSSLLKEMQNPPIAAYPDWRKEAAVFRLLTDWSSYGIGAVLLQLQEGIEKMLMAIGRKCTPAESRYSSIKGELLAGVFAMRRLSHYLLYREFEWHTDSSVLLYLNSLRSTSALISRWSCELAGYRFVIKHVKGCNNQLADGISRWEDHPEEASAEEIAEANQYVHQLTSEVAWAEQVPKLPVSKANLIRSQKADLYLGRVREILALPKPLHPSELKAELPEVRQYLQRTPELHMKDGLLVLETKHRMDYLTGRTIKVVLPQALWELAFDLAHGHAGSGHFGIGPSLSRAKSRFFWLGMGEYFRRKVDSCREGRCKLKTRAIKTKDCVYTPRLAGVFNEEIHLDLLGPIPKDGSYRYIMGIECLYSRYLTLVPLKKKTAQNTCRAILDNWVSYFGPFRRLHTDEGTEFKNQLFGELCSALEVEHSFAPPGAHSSMIIERAFRTLGEMLRSLPERLKGRWSSVLGLLSLAYNSKVHSSIGVSPFLLVLGRAPSLPADLVLPPPQQNYEDDLKARFARIFAYVAERRQERFEVAEKTYTGRIRKFEVGSLVWFFAVDVKSNPISGKKLLSSWSGPMRVIRAQGRSLYRIKPAYVEGARPFSAHVTRLFKYMVTNDNGEHIGPVGLQPPDELLEDIASEPVGDIEVPPGSEMSTPEQLFGFGRHEQANESAEYRRFTEVPDDDPVETDSDEDGDDDRPDHNYRQDLDERGMGHGDEDDAGDPPPQPDPRVQPPPPAGGVPPLQPPGAALAVPPEPPDMADTAPLPDAAPPEPRNTGARPRSRDLPGPPVPIDPPQEGVWTRRRHRLFLEQQEAREKLKKQGNRLKDKWLVAKGKAKRQSGGPSTSRENLVSVQDSEDIGDQKTISLNLYSTSAQMFSPLMVPQVVKITPGSPHSVAAYLKNRNQRGRLGHHAYLFVPGIPESLPDAPPPEAEAAGVKRGSQSDKLPLPLGTNLRAGLTARDATHWKLLSDAEDLAESYQTSSFDQGESTDVTLAPRVTLFTDASRDKHGADLLIDGRRVPLSQRPPPVVKVACHVEIPPGLRDKISVNSVELGITNIWTSKVQVFQPTKLLSGQKVCKITVSHASIVPRDLDRISPAPSAIIPASAGDLKPCHKKSK